LFYLVKNSP